MSTEPNMTIPNPEQFAKDVEDAAKDLTMLQREYFPLIRRDVPRAGEALTEFSDKVGNALNGMMRFSEVPTVGTARRLVEHFKPATRQAIDIAKVDIREEAPINVINRLDQKLSGLYHQLDGMLARTPGAAPDRSGEITR